MGKLADTEHRVGQTAENKGNVRKRLTWILVLSFVICFTILSAWAAQKTYTMKGIIKYIEIIHNTIEGDVTLGHKIFRVAGPLSKDAVLKKRKKSTTLADFKAGDFVTV